VYNLLARRQCDPVGPDPSLPGTGTYSSLRRAPAVADYQRVRAALAAGGSWIRTLGPAATAELGSAGGRSYAAGDVAADARQQTFSFPGDISGHTESKNPVEFRPWSYEFDGKSKCEAM
jgi:hypothetical protein